MLTLRRMDPTLGMARFYAVSIEPSLFGETILIRRWGRIGTHGQRLEMWFSSSDEALSALSEIAARKLRKGYGVVGG